MTCRIAIYALVFVGCTVSGSFVQAQYVPVQNPSEATVIDATNVFAQAMMMQDNQIPRSILANAQAIAIVPTMVRGAFVVGVQYGHGVLVLRDATGAWQAPRMIEVAGGSFGYQIGVQATDLVLVFRTPQSVQNLLRGTIKVGVDASAAAGPVGRQTSAGTDFRTAAEILSYSRARGAFVGVSIDGTSISLDPQAEAIYYQPPGIFPGSAANLLQTINAYAVAPMIAAPMIAAPGQVAVAGGWMPAGTRPAGNVEATRQQLAAASQQLSGNLDETWRSYLGLPREVYTPNGIPNAQDTQQALKNYEAVARDPKYSALSNRPEFQQALSSLRQMADVRVASNTSLQLPPPPR
jgi:lipid-binding SYLF domain-containing protein